MWPKFFHLKIKQHFIFELMELMISAKLWYFFLHKIHWNILVVKDINLGTVLTAELV